MRVRANEKETEIAELRKLGKEREELRQIELMEKIKSHDLKIREAEEAKRRLAEERMAHDYLEDQRRRKAH